MSKKPGSGNRLGDIFGDAFRVLKEAVKPTRPDVEVKNPPSARPGIEVDTDQPSRTAASRKPHKRPVPVLTREPGSSALGDQLRRLKLKDRFGGKKQGVIAPQVSARGRADLTPPPAVSPAPTPRRGPDPPKQCAIDRLREVSPDMRSFRIRGANAVPVRGGLCEPITEWPDGSWELAILGLDFGTAFTKAIVRWQGRHFAVDWSDAVAGNQFLLPSVFSEHTDGTIVLGSLETDGWARKDSIKLRLLSSEGQPSKDELSDAIIFVALAFRHADQWLRKNSSSAKEASIRWRLHLGLPTDSWDDVATTNIFRTIGRAARILACSQGKVSREGTIKALEAADSVGRPAVDVLPEFACQIYSYLESTQRQGDLHALVDVGAGTLDIAFFNVHMEDAENVLPIFAAKVQKLGTHYLLAALAGKNGGARTWRDKQASLDDAGVAAVTGENTTAIASRRGHYLNSVADLYNEAYREARVKYPNSPVFRQGATMRLFLCGGGGRIQSIHERIKRIVTESPGRYDVKIAVVDLVRPSQLANVGEDFDRLSVAYGLSQLAATIGDVIRRGDMKPYFPAEGPVLRDRDEDR